MGIGVENPFAWLTGGILLLLLRVMTDEAGLLESSIAG